MKLREIREEAGLSQTELGARVRRPKDWVNRLEHRRPGLLRLEDINRYAAALGCDLEVVIAGGDPADRWTLW